ncbi:MAG: DUF6298 domain-containing protein [Limisphaerales bacterium]
MKHLRFTIYDLRLAIFIAFVAFVSFPIYAAPKIKLPPIISTGADGKLVYDLDEHGNRVPDFSTAGYAGNEKEIPDAPIRVVVSPILGDETARIQKAIDYVASLPADTNGIHGAILFLKGRHEIFSQLQITNSGIVLRGEGEETNGTILVAAGIDRRTLIRIFGQKDFSTSSNSNWQIADNYVPVGATSFHLKSASGLKIGDRIFITRPSTQQWIDALGMTYFGGGLNDWRLVWHAGNYDLVWDRVIQKIDGNLITIDSPITTAIETKFGGGFVQTYSWPGRIKNVGIENLRLESAYDSQNLKDENHSWFAITMENAANSWIRQITFEHFAGSAIAIYERCKNISVEDCLSLAPISENGGWRRNTFFTMGQQILFLRCRAEHGRHDFSVGHCAAGPNAFVDCEADLPTADSGAIESWASGTLFDSVHIDGNALSLMNRGSDGEGAGWSAANSVLWNCIAAKISCENPPDAQNWAFGSWGEFEGNGIWRHSNESVRPDSLFTAQLADRLGNEAANEILSRAKISTEMQSTKSVDEILNPKSKIRNPKLEISITNGWLVCNGKLVIGGVQPINWWRGNMIPSAAKNYGVNLTRFAPGRIGAGFTDDLKEVADDGMISKNLVALDHHYGLWYDRRREDHERVRRMSGDVWPPFYEQPFTRSGIGTAWDGLSKYDLTKFNPWYWSRLKNFADICDERGLILFNENYFQHNILEDGAHWVDCPWRSQNNINDTGFHEPPFEVAKRIVMAPQFYDVNNPIRRKLDENYIRQNLNNFTNEPNVIQLTSAEFTGPLAFEQFWLDTIGDWEREHFGSGTGILPVTGLTSRAAGDRLEACPTKPLIALAATKDVQDAILADAKRAAVVNVICFRYWWQTDKGLFAPHGGQNQSPRQFERQWKGGPPNDENLATMASEYRQKFPSKVIIASGEDESFHGSWAFLCAGGSVPDLPATTDKNLLAAIPQMQPWISEPDKKIWALRESGKKILIYVRANGPPQIDLSNETGTFDLHSVNLKTGEVKNLSKKISAGAKVNLPNETEPEVLWLTRE